MDLGDDPAVISMAELLDRSEDELVGKLHRLWSWADRHATDGFAKAITARWVDKFTGVAGFGDAMSAAGWLIFKDEGVTFPNFDKHNGKSAKTRCNATTRQRESRKPCDKSVTHVTDPSRQDRDKSVTREEERREEEEPPPPQGAGGDQTGPSVEECETDAKQCFPADPEFAASVGRQFHAMFAVKQWQTQGGHDLRKGGAWKHRLRQMIEEEARKGISRKGAPAPAAKSKGMEFPWEKPGYVAP
jgi:hypothetical protein